MIFQAQDSLLFYCPSGDYYFTKGFSSLKLGREPCQHFNQLLWPQFPEMAASLLPICEVFGSITNAKPVATSNGEELSAHMVFTVAFLQLVKLWKFHRPPLEHCLLGSGAGLGADLSLEYLLQLRNMQLASPAKQRMQVLGSTYTSPPNSAVITLDSFPRLRIWYMQHQACISSTVTGLVRNNPVHSVGDRLLAMMFKKVNKSSSAPSTPNEDVAGRPVLCAWDIIAAAPIVLEYALTACSHGTLPPRDLTTGMVAAYTTKVCEKSSMHFLR